MSPLDELGRRPALFQTCQGRATAAIDAPTVTKLGIRKLSMVSAVSLDIVTGGWELPGWRRDLYPEDLPADWRLTYFANEFPAVMLAAKHWLPADAVQLKAWAEDVPDDFRFYLEDAAPAAGRQDLDLALRVLGPKLAGLVQEAGADASLPVDGFSRFRILGAPVGLPGTGCLPAWRVPRAQIRDLRAARTWLEGLCAQAPGGRGLLLLAGADVGVEDLRRWWHLVWLLGLA